MEIRLTKEEAQDLLAVFSTLLVHTPYEELRAIGKVEERNSRAAIMKISEALFQETREPAGNTTPIELTKEVKRRDD